MATKSAWRRWAAALRQAPTPGESERLVTVLHAFLSDRPARILTYKAMAHELNIDPLAELLDPDSLRLTRTPARGPLTVHPFNSELETHRFGFEQPTADSATTSLDEIEVALVPGVLFSRDGARLGHGRGYYDELLARCKPTAILIGVTLEAQVVRELPTAGHDIAMTHLATENGVVPTPISGHR